MEDTDVPAPRPALHMIALLDPSTRALPQGALTKDDPAIRHLPAALRSTGCAGPPALPGHGVHHYGFHLCALDRPVPPGVGDLKALLAHADGHVTAHGHLQGTHERH